MFVRLMSDLHTEFWKLHKRERMLLGVIPVMPEDKETVLCIAGDLGLLHQPTTWLVLLKNLAERFKAVIYVCGNHEFYNNPYFNRVKWFAKEMKLPDNVHMLEDDFVCIDGVAFIGATLWTSFNSRDPLAMMHAATGMTDFEAIKYGSGCRIRPLHTADIFYDSKGFIFGALKTFRDLQIPTVVITHHAPSFMSVSSKYRGDLLNHAFATELGYDIIDIGPQIWLHGHMHDSFDYMLGDTNVICNPYGYNGHALNMKFKRKLRLEVK